MKRKINGLIILLNIIILFVAGIYYGKLSQEELIFEQIPLYSWGGATGQYNYVDDTYGDAKFWFSVDFGKLPKGLYQVTFFYETDSADNSVRIYADPDVHNAVIADSMNFETEYQLLSREVWVNRKVDNVGVAIDRSNIGYLQIDRVVVTRSRFRSFTYLMLCLLCKLLVGDGLVWLIENWKKVQKNYVLVIGFTGIVFLSSMCAFSGSIIEGHDIWFHLARIEGIKEGLLSGAFPVKIQPNWLHGYTFAVSAMYGEILLYVPAMLRVLGIPMQFSYQCYVVFINILTAFAAYTSYRGISKNKYIGLAATAMYMLSNYRIGSIWIRAGVGEYSAMIFFPLVLYGIWELLVDENTKQNRTKGWIWLAVGYVGMIQTHILSCEIVTVFVAFACLLRIKRVFQKETFLAFCKAVGTVIALNIWFLIPFLDYFTREDFKVFSERNVDYVQRVGVSLYQMLSLVTAGRGTYQRYNPAISGRVPFSLGVAMTLIVLIALILLVRPVELRTVKKKTMGMILGLIILCCMMSTDLFPWDSISLLNEALAELVVSIRRPCRLMTVAVTLVPLLLCMELEELRQIDRNYLLKGVVTSVGVVCALETLLFSDFIMRGNSVITCYDGDQINWDYAVSGQEYFYTGTNCKAALTDTEVTGTVVLGYIERNANRFMIDYIAEEEGYIECPISYYPGYRAYNQNTGETFEVSRGENNKLHIEIPAGSEGTLQVRFMEPWYWRMAEMLSLCVIIGYIVYGMLWKKKKNLRLKGQIQ